jgi:hypothetical protein
MSIFSETTFRAHKTLEHLHYNSVSPKKPSIYYTEAHFGRSNRRAKITGDANIFPHAPFCTTRAPNMPHAISARVKSHSERARLTTP